MPVNVKQHKMEPQTPPGLPLSGEEVGSPPDKGELEGVRGKRWSNLARRFIIRGGYCHAR